MPLPRHRLDLSLVTQPPDRPVDEGALQEAGVDVKLWVRSGVPGEAADTLVAGGWASVRLESYPRSRLVVNRLGGFRVSCPTTSAPIVKAFERAMSAYRSGGPRALEACPACGDDHPLEALSYAPVAAFGRGVIVLVDVPTASVGAEGLAALSERVGPLAVVPVRPG